MASLVLSGDSSGSITVSAPAVAGSTTQTLVNVTGTLAPIVSGTAVTASGTSVDFTGIPSWVKRITLMFQGVSTSGVSAPIIQLGTGGSPTTSGYVGSSSRLQATTIATNTYTGEGFNINAANIAASVMSGAISFCLLTGNTWTGTGILSGTGTNLQHTTAGHISLSGTLNFVRITTVGGTDTFDAGTINILYE